MADYPVVELGQVSVRVVGTQKRERRITPSNPLLSGISEGLSFTEAKVKYLKTVGAGKGD